MTAEFPPPYISPPSERVVVTDQVQATRSFEKGVPGVHLIVQGTAYFIPSNNARKVARKILFNED